LSEAIILINTETGLQTIEDVYKKVKNLKEISLAAMLLGPYDVIAWAKADNISDINNVLLDEIRNIDGVKSTLTSTVVEASKRRM